MAAWQPPNTEFPPPPHHDRPPPPPPHGHRPHHGPPHSVFGVGHRPHHEVTEEGIAYLSRQIEAQDFAIAELRTLILRLLPGPDGQNEA